MPAALLEKEGGMSRELCTESANLEEIQAMVKRASVPMTRRNRGDRIA